MGTVYESTAFTPVLTNNSSRSAAFLRSFTRVCRPTRLRVVRTHLAYVMYKTWAAFAAVPIGGKLRRYTRNNRSTRRRECMDGCMTVKSGITAGVMQSAQSTSKKLRFKVTTAGYNGGRNHDAPTREQGR